MLKWRVIFLKREMMPENAKILNSVSSKVAELLVKYEEACETIENLRNELISTKAQSEAKSAQIERLEEELRQQDIVSSDIFKQVEAVLGKN